MLLKNLLQNHSTSFNQTCIGTKHSWIKGIEVCSNKELHSFSKGDNYEIAKNTLAKFNNLLHKHSSVKGNQIYLNEGPSPFPRGDIYEIAKMH